MSDLNEYVAEAAEIAYGVDYDTDKATELIRTLQKWNWYILDGDELDGDEDGAA